MITVIVPIYNTPQNYLKKCIESILSQSYSDLELLLIDDGSEKECAQFIDSQAAQDIRCKAVHTRNGGVSAARNIGLFMAKGEYVTFVDSDDWIEEEYLKHLIETIENYDLSIVKYRSSNEKINNYTDHKKTFCTDKIHIINSILRYKNGKRDWMLNTCWGKLYRKSLIDTYKVYFDTELRRLEDADFNLQYFLRETDVSLGFSESIDYILRIHPDSTVHKYNPKLGEDLILPLIKMENRLRNANYYVQFCHALGYRALLNGLIYLSDGVFNVKNKKRLQISNFFDNEIVQHLLRQVNEKKLNMTENYIVINAKRKNYSAICLFFRVKNIIKRFM